MNKNDNCKKCQYLVEELNKQLQYLISKNANH